MFKKYVKWRLEKYVKKYFKNHHPALIVVVGAVGKTTTKTAIATVLSKRYRVQMEPGNHNSELSVPLAIMGVKFPPVSMLRSYSTWRHVFKAMRQRIKAPQGVDVIVQELATDKPGDLAEFGKYLSPDIAIVTAVAPEHMENFQGGLSDVAREELSIARFSKLTVINHDDVDSSFAVYAETNSITDYGITGGEYRLDIAGGSPLDGYDILLHAPELGDNQLSTIAHLVGNHNLKAACAGLAVGIRMGLTPQDLSSALSEIKPVAGRMNPLPGVRNSTIIDDTYNSSPTAAMAALDTLYQIESDNKIAILGSMNELGPYSAQAHQQLGEYCDPLELDFVITIGEDAARYLAPSARRRGNQVIICNNPVTAGSYANQYLKPGGIVLAKGSQNGVFAEEAVKVLLRSADDRSKLVRQDPDWLKSKDDWLNSLTNQAPNIDQE